MTRKQKQQQKANTLRKNAKATAGKKGDAKTGKKQQQQQPKKKNPKKEGPTPKAGDNKKKVESMSEDQLDRQLEDYYMSTEKGLDAALESYMADDDLGDIIVDEE
eukprot:m.42343 g.42343  ORF g.42343 m.42343 type:complete len:105 (-) comp7054_c1_seq1:1490-1804(-)